MLFCRNSDNVRGIAGWQRDLSVSHYNVGVLLLAQGDKGAALKEHQAALAITERLAQTDPKNALWQRDLGPRYHRGGQILKNQDKDKLAREFFGKGAQSYAGLASSMGDFYNAACCYALMGDKDQAFAALGKAVERAVDDIGMPVGLDKGVAGKCHIGVSFHI